MAAVVGSFWSMEDDGDVMGVYDGAVGFGMVGKLCVGLYRRLREG